MDKIIPAELKSVLVVRIGKIGDIIATSFVFEVIKKNNPGLEISLITKASNKNVLKYNRSIDKIYFLGSGLKRILQIWKIKKNKFDLIIDFNDNPSKTSKYIFSCLTGTYKCGYDFPLYSNCLDIKVPQLNKENSHIIERMKHFLVSIGFTTDEGLVKPVLYTGEQELQEASLALSHYIGKKIISLNISAGADIRFWGVEKWIELVNKISQMSGEYRFVLLNTPDNAGEAEEILKAIGKERMLKPILPTFQHFAAYIKLSNMLITPDTSAVHIASAFGIPVIALFPKSDWNFASWQPYKVPQRSVHSSTEDINSISIDEIFIKFKELNREIS